MRYVIGKGISGNKRSKLPVVLGIVMLLGGVYLLLNTLSPVIPDFGSDPEATSKKLKASEPKIGEDRIYMPQINVDVAVVEVGQNETEAQALDRGAIHRAPANGNPKDGGNFVLAAHRFTLGLTPALTREKSPFYHIDQIKVDDQIFVDYKGIRYAYRVYEKRTVEPSEVSIERRTNKPQLTVYSCTLSGENDGRVVLFAEPVGTVTWDDGGQAHIDPNGA